MNRNQRGGVLDKTSRVIKHVCCGVNPFCYVLSCDLSPVTSQPPQKVYVFSDVNDYLSVILTKDPIMTLTRYRLIRTSLLYFQEYQFVLICLSFAMVIRPNT